MLASAWFLFMSKEREKVSSISRWFVQVVSQNCDTRLSLRNLSKCWRNRNIVGQRGLSIHLLAQTSRSWKDCFTDSQRYPFVQGLKPELLPTRITVDASKWRTSKPSRLDVLWGGMSPQLGGLHYSTKISPRRHYETNWTCHVFVAIKWNEVPRITPN